MNNNERYLIKSLIKSITVLELISKKEKMSIKEIDEETKFGKSTIFRILTTLKELNYVDQDIKDSKYFATMKIIELGKNISNQLPIKDISRKYLEKLFNECKETVNLGIVVGCNVIYLDKITTNEPLRIELEIERKVPIYCSALGKSILAFNNSIQFDDLEYEKFTSKTITNKEDLENELAEVRLKGYAFDNEEYIEHLVCMAVPILNRYKKAIASISIAIPSIRLNKQKKDKFIKELKSCSRQIEEEINKLYVF